MKKLLSIALLSGLVATGAFANTKVGVYLGGGAGNYTVDNNDHSHDIKTIEGGIFIDTVKGYFYGGAELGVGKYTYGNNDITMVTVTGKLGFHFNALKGINVYGLSKAGYGSKTYDDMTFFGYGAGIGFNLSSHWGIELNYIHSKESHIYTIENPDLYYTYPTFQYTTNRGEAFIKYSF